MAQEYETNSDRSPAFRLGPWLIENRRATVRSSRMSLAAIVLAAGQGTRMRSDLPKVLHPPGSAPLIAHALTTARALEPERTVVVVGHGGAAVEAAARALDEEVAVVTQAEQKGTGHAVLQALPALDGFAGDAL